MQNLDEERRVKRDSSSMTPRPWTLWSIRVLSLIGLIISGYLAWHSWNTGAHLAGCGEEGAGCEEVIQTKWSSWLGLPVSAGGLLVYAVIFVLSILIGKKSRRLHWVALVFLTIVAAGSALWFIMLQMFVIKSYCFYCLTVHACSIALMLLVWRQAPMTKPSTVQGAKRDQAPGLTTRQVVQAAIAGLAGVAILIAGQLLPGRSAEAENQPEAQTQTERTKQKKQESAPAPQPQTPEVRQVALLNGQFSIPMGEFPVLGSPNAQRVAAHFFDYTCPACRQLHSSLLDAHKKVENDVALVLIPMPLDATCNPGVRETSYQHQNACLFAQMGIALWSLSPVAFNQYDEYMFRFQYPPSAEQAVSMAYELVGKEKMNAAMADPHNGNVLRQGIDMFYLPAIEKKMLPVLVMPEQAVYGTPKTEDLPRLLSAPLQ